MSDSLEKLRRQASRLKKAFRDGDAQARIRVAQRVTRPDGARLSHADFLHVIAQEQGFASWPALKQAVELNGMDRAEKLQRLKIAIYNGHNDVVRHLLEEDASLPQDAFGLQVALYDVDAVRAVLKRDPGAAVRDVGNRVPMMHLAISHYIHVAPERQAEMLAMAELLLAHGADVNASIPVGAGNDHPLSALYGAIGHADNMALARWLLANGADPNDGESLYHATELGHHEGLRMLLEAGPTRPAPTHCCGRWISRMSRRWNCCWRMARRLTISTAPMSVEKPHGWFPRCTRLRGGCRGGG